MPVSKTKPDSKTEWDTCPKCRGTGKCKCCEGTGEIEHKCERGMFTRLDKPERRPMGRMYASYDSITYHQCKCGIYWKHYYQYDPGAGSSSEWFRLGESYEYKSFTQEDLDRVLKQNEEVEDASQQSKT